jgi:hypothetical protein
VFEPGKRIGIHLFERREADVKLYCLVNPRPSLRFKANQYLARVPQPPAPDLLVRLAT